MSNLKLVTLFRPVGQKEFELVRASDFRFFPPRLSHQPIFYPVLEREYAEAIARDWNTRDEASGNVGYVLSFQVRADFLADYVPQVVGARLHREYWIPAERLSAFNEAIVGEIEVVAEFR